MINSPTNLNFQLNCQSLNISTKYSLFTNTQTLNVGRFIKLNLDRFTRLMSETNLAFDPMLTILPIFVTAKKKQREIVCLIYKTNVTLHESTHSLSYFSNLSRNRSKSLEIVHTHLTIHPLHLHLCLIIRQSHPKDNSLLFLSNRKLRLTNRYEQVAEAKENHNAFSATPPSSPVVNPKLQQSRRDKRK